jgi:hypothetical protein
MDEAKKDEIAILSEVDVLRAIRNIHVEKKMQALIREKYFKRRKNKPRNGDDMRKLKDSIRDAQNNIDDNQAMVDIIDEELKAWEEKAIYTPSDGDKIV